MCFTVFGEDRLQRFNIQEGQYVSVSFDIEAREYQGRWFNSIRAYDVRQVVPGAQQNSQFPPQGPQQFPPQGPQQFPPQQILSQGPQQQTNQPQGSQQAEDKADDLPF